MDNAISKVILIAANKEVAKNLQGLLSDADRAYEMQIAIGSADGMAQTAAEDFPVVIVDLDWLVDVDWYVKGTKRSNRNGGLKVIEDLHKSQPHVPIIAVTAMPLDAATTIDPIMMGASDCIQKPTNDEQLKEFQLALRKAFDVQKCSETVVQNISIHPVNGIVGHSRPLKYVFRRIAWAAATPQSVLITGETGTGKELFARLIHDKSRRADKPYKIVDCAALPETLAESELFGHAKGAFTGATERKGRFQEANGGTIFLDEIGELSLGLQKKLLRFLQEKTVQPVGSNETIPLDVKVIAATNRDLKKACENKEFRQDLYFRLSKTLIVLPPLRERKEDIPDLVYYFMQEDGSESCAHRRISLEALEFLQERRWPGNIRQLRNVVHDALSHSNGFGITLDIVREAFSASDDSEQKTSFEKVLIPYITELVAQAKNGKLTNSYKFLLAQMEPILLKAAYDEAGQSIPETAKLLGLSYPCTKKRLKHYGLFIEKKSSKKRSVPNVLKGHLNEVLKRRLDEGPEGHFETSPAF